MICNFTEHAQPIQMAHKPDYIHFSFFAVVMWVTSNFVVIALSTPPEIANMLAEIGNFVSYNTLFSICNKMYIDCNENFTPILFAA